jgi:hypothetical protein
VRGEVEGVRTVDIGWTHLDEVNTNTWPESVRLQQRVPAFAAGVEDDHESGCPPPPRPRIEDQTCEHRDGEKAVDHGIARTRATLAWIDETAADLPFAPVASPAGEAPN